MILRKISLHNFRNFSDKSLEVDSRLTIIIGENSRGKTNILEAIHFLLEGRGFREEKEEELLSFKKSEMYVEGIVADSDRQGSHLKIFGSQAENGFKKIFYVDKLQKSHRYYVDGLPAVVIFTPEDLVIINGSPSDRRQYFNKVISASDIIYRKKLINYESALRKRNKIIEKNRLTQNIEGELDFWNSYLEEQATYLTKKRQEYVDFVNNDRKLDSREFSIVYEKNVFTLKRAQESLERELIVKKTLIGPQKDDFQIYVSDKKLEKNLHRFGSRSEERLGVFWLKLNELKFHESSGTKPILLLDDIFSELDNLNKKLILTLIGRYQTLATTTEEEVVKEIAGEKTIIRI